MWLFDVDNFTFENNAENNAHEPISREKVPGKVHGDQNWSHGELIRTYPLQLSSDKEVASHVVEAMVC